MNAETFYKLLEQKYDGDVVPVEEFETPRAAIQFHCKVCGYTFYNRPDWLLTGSTHKCMFNYPDVHGSRTKKVVGKVKQKTKKKLSKATQKEIDRLLATGLAPKYIALNVGESVGSVVYYLNK